MAGDGQDPRPGFYLPESRAGAQSHSGLREPPDAAVVITVSLRTTQQHLSQLEETRWVDWGRFGRQTAIRSQTHHGIGFHRHPSAVGQVVEDIGWFGQQVAAGTHRVRLLVFVFTSVFFMLRCESDSPVLLQVQQEESSPHLQPTLQLFRVAVLKQTGDQILTRQRGGKRGKGRTSEELLKTKVEPSS